MGLLTGCAALGVGQLVAGITGGMSAPLVAVGNTAIDASPQAVKTFAIDTFGSNDKMALLIGIGVILAIFAVTLGIASVRRPRVGLVGIGVFGLVGALAAITRPTGTPVDVLPSIIGAGAGALSLLYMRRAMGDRGRAGAGAGRFERTRRRRRDASPGWLPGSDGTATTAATAAVRPAAVPH